MAEIYFYHLEREPAEDVLAVLIAKGLQRDLRMSVESPDRESLARLSEKLWSLEDVAFIPHGMADEADAASQPVLLSMTDNNANASTFRFFINGAEPAETEAYERVSILFDATDAAALEKARGLWRGLKSDRHVMSYWRQSGQGGWEKQAG
jgi:DNA polymerase III subunit chi